MELQMRMWWQNVTLRIRATGRRPHPRRSARRHLHYSVASTVLFRMESISLERRNAEKRTTQPIIR
ncbi:hypothetical protein HW555_002261 [Spodoptera exigua]|uniref:Uncharacterized protein n=1 Tax=Spodoptera exigua TaxID=7107 RepID=A0A835L814_SPOEX|nr:hypothetical protein HW555_002261 [Spodoptera exigua]